MSRYRVQLISSVPGLPAGASAEITDTYSRLLETLEEAQALVRRAMAEPPPAHTGRVVDARTGAVVWEIGPGTR